MVDVAPSVAKLEITPPLLSDMSHAYLAMEETTLVAPEPTHLFNQVSVQHSTEFTARETKSEDSSIQTQETAQSQKIELHRAECKDIMETPNLSMTELVDLQRNPQSEQLVDMLITPPLAHMHTTMQGERPKEHPVPINLVLMESTSPEIRGHIDGQAIEDGIEEHLTIEIEPARTSVVVKEHRHPSRKELHRTIGLERLVPVTKEGVMVSKHNTGPILTSQIPMETETTSESSGVNLRITTVVAKHNSASIEVRPVHVESMEKEPARVSVTVEEHRRPSRQKTKLHRAIRPERLVPVMTDGVMSSRPNRRNTGPILTPRIPIKSLVETASELSNMELRIQRATLVPEPSPASVKVLPVHVDSRDVASESTAASVPGGSKTVEEAFEDCSNELDSMIGVLTILAFLAATSMVSVLAVLLKHHVVLYPDKTKAVTQNKL